MARRDRDTKPLFRLVKGTKHDLMVGAMQHAKAKFEIMRDISEALASLQRDRGKIAQLIKRGVLKLSAPGVLVGPKGDGDISDLDGEPPRYARNVEMMAILQADVVCFAAGLEPPTARELALSALDAGLVSDPGIVAAKERGTLEESDRRGSSILDRLTAEWAQRRKRMRASTPRRRAAVRRLK